MKNEIPQGNNENGLPEPTKQAPLQQAQAIAERIVGETHWRSDTEGYCTCPGSSFHSTAHGAKDCRIRIDGAPTVFCFHQGCRDSVVEANRRLRAEFQAAGIQLQGKGQKTSPEDKRRLGEIREQERLNLRAKAMQERLIKAYRWPLEQIVKDSPVPVVDNVSDHWRLLLGLFQPDDVVWVGDKTDSGKPMNWANFRKVSDWLKLENAVGPFTCPATFKPESFSRSNENVVTRRFLVVESDVLSKDQVGAIFRWLDREVGLPLRAIVDTAGKSLHGWFDFPPPKIESELKGILPGLGCDPGMFRASQPCRMPSVLRDGRPQHLVYVKGGK